MTAHCIPSALIVQLARGISPKDFYLNLRPPCIVIDFSAIAVEDRAWKRFIRKAFR